MPTHAELGRKYEFPKTRLDQELESWNERLTEAIKIEVGKRVAKGVVKITRRMICMNSLFEYLWGKCEEVLNENTYLRAENAFVKSNNDILDTVINQLKQCSRSNNIEIRGILIVKDEESERERRRRLKNNNK